MSLPLADWQIDKGWSDQFLPEIKSILGRHLIGEASEEEDQIRNTDLVVLRVEAKRVAVRIRRLDYLDRYGDQFTIRASRPGGTKTELTKVVEGWGDYFFYGFGCDETSSLAAWGLGDLGVFRLWFNRYLVRNNGKVPGMLRDNGDGSSRFAAFRWTDLPPAFVVDSSNLDKAEAS